MDKLRKGTTFCVYTRGAVELLQEAVTICSRANVGAKTSDYINAFTGRQEVCREECRNLPFKWLVITDMTEAIVGSELIGRNQNDPVCDCTDAMLAALWSLQRLSFRHLVQEVWDIAMEDDDPLKGLESALHLSTMYKNQVCNPESWKPYISSFPKLQRVIAKAYEQAIRFEKDFCIDVTALKERNTEDDENSESEDSDDEHGESEDSDDESVDDSEESH